MIPMEIIGLTVIGCSAFYVPGYLWMLKRERAVVDAQALLIDAERKKLFYERQNKASQNAALPCRMCSTCKRVVHNYRPEGPGYICRECDLR